MTRDAATVTTVSIVRGAWEVRCVHLAPDGAPGWPDAVALRVGGWPVTGGRPPRRRSWTSRASPTSGTHEAHDATPLRSAGRTGSTNHHPLARGPIPGSPGLVPRGARPQRRTAGATRRVLAGPPGPPTVTVTWPDGATTACRPARTTSTHQAMRPEEGTPVDRRKFLSSPRRRAPRRRWPPAPPASGSRRRRARRRLGRRADRQRLEPGLHAGVPGPVRRLPPGEPEHHRQAGRHPRRRLPDQGRRRCSRPATPPTSSP